MSLRPQETSRLAASIVIPAYKRPELVKAVVRSALAQDMAADAYEVIVVDSSPDDINTGIIEALRAEAGGVSLTVLRKAPEGPGPSRALGARQARGTVVAYLDSDCTATPGWLEAGLRKFREGIGIVQGRTLPRPDQAIGTFCRYVRIEAENPRYEAANIFFRRDALIHAGEPLKDMTPDHERPTGGEDALMAWRVKRSGWGSTFAHEALVYHEVIPITIWDWLYEKRMVMLPWLAREIPEMRSEFYCRYFLDRAHAGLVLLLAGVALSPLSVYCLAAVLPYLYVRVSEPTRTLRGPKRLVRVLVYLPRDLLAFGLLSIGSLRYGVLLL